MKSSFYKKSTLSRISKKMTSLGYDKNKSPILFLNIRIVSCLLVFCLLIAFIKWGLIIAPVICIILYYLFEYLIFDLRIKGRKNKLEYDAVIFFKMVLVGLKSHKDLFNSLTIACNYSDNILAKDFKIVLNEYELGKSFNDAIVDMKSRIPSRSIINLLNDILESGDKNKELIDSISNHVDELEKRNNLEKRKKINLIPIKINVLSFIFVVLASLLIYYALKGLGII